MKNLFLLSVIVVVISTLSMSCSSPHAVEPLLDKQIRLLSKTWKVDKVYFGESPNTADSTAHWGSFKITISGTTGVNTLQYVCTGRPKLSAWPISGALQFESSNLDSKLMRDDNLEIQYSVDSNASKLQMTFNFTGTGYTRVESVGGYWTFVLIPDKN